jgi:hypothetical protein
MHVLLSLTPTPTCWLSHLHSPPIKDSTTPNLFRITTWLGIRKTSCVRSINSAADSHARAGLLLPVFYVIGEAMINKVGIGQSVLFF